MKLPFLFAVIVFADESELLVKDQFGRPLPSLSLWSICGCWFCRRGGNLTGDHQRSKLLAFVLHQIGNLLTTHRPTQITQCPTRVQNDGLARVDIVIEELALLQTKISLSRTAGSVIEPCVDTALSSPASNRALSRSVCNFPMNHVPAFDSAL